MTNFFGFNAITTKLREELQHLAITWNNQYWSRYIFFFCLSIDELSRHYRWTYFMWDGFIKRQKMVKSVSRFLSTRKFTMKSKFIHSLSNSLAIHIDLPQKKWFKRNAEQAHPKLFSRGKRSRVNVSRLQFTVGYITYFLLLDVSISEFSSLSNKQPALILSLVPSRTLSHS